MYAFLPSTAIFRMKKSSRTYLPIVLLLANLLLFLLSNYSHFADNQYLEIIYPTVSYVLRSFSALAPFSMGDVLYGLAFLLGFYSLIKFIKLLFNKESWINSIVWQKMIGLINLLLAIYLIFQIFWGVNYYQSSLAKKFQLHTEAYTIGDLVKLNQILIQDANELRQQLPDSIIHQHIDFNMLRFKTIDAFEITSGSYPLLRYTEPSLKSSMFSRQLSYWGISGYYNPFTGEAQVNTDMPDFIQPFVACHEVAHQLGFARENEANFIGYLAASNSRNVRIRYAAAFEMMLYANRSLHYADSAAALRFRQQMDTAVKKDIQLLKEFSASHRSVLEPVTDKLYEWFLQYHGQPKGLMTYEMVTVFLISHFKQQGRMK